MGYRRHLRFSEWPVSRYFKDTVAVFGWAQGMSEEKDFQLRDFSKVSSRETLSGGN